jgi:hypothetical protein
MIEKPKKERRFLKVLGRVGEILIQEVLLKVGSNLIKRIGGKKTLPSILFLFLSISLFAQYPATGNKQRLGYQTTGDGLVFRGRSSDTITIKSSGLNNAYFILDTVNNVLFNYIKTKGGWVFNNTDTVINNITVDTASLSNRINLRVRYIDTAYMLLPYLRKADTTSILTPYFKKSDTTSLNLVSRFAAKQNILNGTGFVKASGTTISYDNSSYLRTGLADSTYLKLTGGTLSGALNGTTGTFTTRLGVGSVEASSVPTLFTSGSGDQEIHFTHNDNIPGRKVSLRLTNANSGFYTFGGLIYALQGEGLNQYNRMTLGINTTEVLHLTRFSRVGIMNNSPSFTLDVNGTLGVTGATTLSNLSGDTTRMVTASSSGVLSTQAIPTGTLGGSGTINYIPKFTGTSTLGDANLFTNGNRFVQNEGGDQSFGWDKMGNTSSPFFGNNVKAGTAHERIQRVASTTLFNPSAIIFGFQRTNNSSGATSLGGINFMTTSDNPSGDINPIDFSRMFIQPTGNIGIGTMEPSYKFDIRGTLGVTGATTLTGALTVNNTTVLNEGSGDFDTRIESDGNANMVFVDASTDRVGIGTGSPSKTLDINGEVKIATVTATPTSLLGKDPSNVVGEVTDINQSGVMKVGSTIQNTSSVGTINVAHGLSYTPTKVIATIGQQSSYVIVCHGITSTNLNFTVYDSTDGTPLDNISVGFFYIAFK